MDRRHPAHRPHTISPAEQSLLDNAYRKLVGLVLEQRETGGHRIVSVSVVVKAGKVQETAAPRGNIEIIQ